jgi:hypothetical protein
LKLVSLAQPAISWQNEFMAKPSSEKRDFMQVAREIVEQAIGEHIDGTPLQATPDTRNPHAVALGSAGGKKGGKARAKALSAARRSEIAHKAANTRWKRK